MGKSWRAETEEAWRATTAMLPTLSNHGDYQPGHAWTWSSPQLTQCDISLQDARKSPSTEDSQALLRTKLWCLLALFT